LNLCHAPQKMENLPVTSGVYESLKARVREQQLGLTIDDLQFVSSDLIPLIIEYERDIRYDNKSMQTWTFSYEPFGLFSDSKFIYLCAHSEYSSLQVFTFDGQTISDKKLELTQPSAGDFYQNYFYIIDKLTISKWDIQWNFTSSFEIPTNFLGWNHLKVDQDIIYASVVGYNEVFAYNQDGKIENTIGKTKSGHEDGEFNQTAGIATKNNNLFICDYVNNRIQIFYKENKNYIFKKKFSGDFLIGPYSILLYEDFIYVSGHSSIEIFTLDGSFLSKITGKEENQIKFAKGICVIGDRLYVSESKGHRIQVFRRTENPIFIL